MLRRLPSVILRIRQKSLLESPRLCLRTYTPLPVLLPASYLSNKESLRQLHHSACCRSCDDAEKESSPLGQVGVKMRILFTCNKCSTRNDKIMSKQAYEKGIVLIRCDGCENLHLIADNLDWFKDPLGKNVEEILASKGRKVQRGDVYEFNNLEGIN